MVFACFAFLSFSFILRKIVCCRFAVVKLQPNKLFKRSSMTITEKRTREPKAVDPNGIRPV